MLTQLHMNVTSFTDVNECLTNNGNCAQDCANTVGSYMCSCNVGYVLNGDGRNCSGNETRWIQGLNKGAILLLQM